MIDHVYLNWIGQQADNVQASSFLLIHPSQQIWSYEERRMVLFSTYNA
jgi:hypothetical protein